METANDESVFDRAANEDRAIISADTDFGTILALRREVRPSVILLRRPGDRRPDQQARLLLANLGRLQEALVRGSIIVFDSDRIRVRTLPIGTQ